MISCKTDTMLAIALACTAIALPAAAEAAPSGTRIDVYASAAHARNAEVFRRIEPGMKAEEVRERLGSPDRSMRFAAAHATAWDYDFRDTWGGRPNGPNARQSEGVAHAGRRVR
jgi:outer membrane protein assembly factor BamE (lipoprotein component of BamABCDE complex)